MNMREKKVVPKRRHGKRRKEDFNEDKKAKMESNTLIMTLLLKLKPFL